MDGAPENQVIARSAIPRPLVWKRNDLPEREREREKEKENEYKQRASLCFALHSVILTRRSFPLHRCANQHHDVTIISRVLLL